MNDETDGLYTENQLKRKTKDDLLIIATEQFGIEHVHDGLEKKDLVELILSAQEEVLAAEGELPEIGAAIEPDDEDPSIEPAEPDDEAHTVDQSRFVEISSNVEADRVKVIFHNTGLPGGDTPVEGSLNGRAFRYPREEEVKVPRVYLKALMDAAEEHYKQIKRVTPEGEVEMELKATLVRRYPFTVIEDPKAGGSTFTIGR